MSLSNIEEKVYFAALDAGPVPFGTIQSWNICSSGTLKVVVHRLVKKGYFQRIKKGLYLAKKRRTEAHDVLLLAQHLYSGYAAFSTALYIHRLSDELPFTIFVATKSRSEERPFGTYAVKAVSLGKRFLGSEKKEGMTVSTIPKTIYDCLRLPQYAGGFPHVLKAVFNARMDDAQWNEFLYYVDSFESHAFCQRAGFMLDLLKKETKAAVPRFVLEHLKGARMYTVRLGTGEGTGIKEWKLVDCMGKEKLLHWWYHG